MSAWRCLHLRAIITRPHDFKVIFQPLEYSSASQRHRAHFSHDSHRPVHPKLGMSTHLFIPTPKRRTGAISTDINDNCRRNGSPDRVNRLRTAAGRVGSTPIKLNNMTTMTTASFPLLDDVTAGLVASFLPVKDLGLRWARGVAAGGTAVLCCFMSTCANGINAGGVNCHKILCDFLLAQSWPFFRGFE